ncbi:MAG TPA: APC family permease [Acidimicrobiales bacterium]|nr:APC family permease [Acidimicrobiales bacterium]
MTEVDTPVATSPPAPSAGETATLRANELNLFDSTVVAVSSVAPAYSLAATLSLLFAAVGVGYAGPAVIIVSFIPVLFIAVAYFYLNRRDANCGACYAWLSKLVSPSVGWFNGWVQVAASALFCVAAPVLAGGYTLQFLHSIGWINAGTASNTWLTAAVGVLWLALITLITIYGIRWTANAQWVSVLIQYAALLGASIWGIVKVAVKHPVGSTGFHWSWLDPFSIHGYEGLAAGSVLGLFFFWGWDTAINLNEESKKASKVPGQAGIISMFLLLFVFALNIVSAQMLLPARELSGQGANLLFYFGEQVGGHWVGYLIIIAVLSSTVADTQTTLLPAARVTFSMARDGVYPRVFGIIHGKFQTPMIGTLILAGLALFGIVLRVVSPAVNSGYGNLIDDIGVLVAFYYGATGLACAWAYRKVMFRSVRFFFTGSLAPFLGGAFCFWVGYEVIVQSGLKASAPVLVDLVLGIPLVIVARVRNTTAFFKQHPIAYTSID